MAGSFSPDGDPTTRTLLRGVLDSADPRTPRRPRSPGPGPPSPHSSQGSRTLRSQTLRSAQRARLETLPSRGLGSHTKASARPQGHSHGAKAVGRWPHVPASGHLEEQTPRTLLKNILLTAPESSIVRPRSAAGTPVLAPPVVQPSRRESSRGSLDLQLPELEPPTPLAVGVLAPGRRKQRLRLSVFQQEVDQGLPLSQEPPRNSDPPSLTSSLSLTPLRSQSVKRPGLARRPPARRAVDVAAFLRDLQDSSTTSGALASAGDSHRTPAATLLKETVLEDTQPFSPPLVGGSFKVRLSLPAAAPAPTTSPGAAGAQRLRGRRTWSGRSLRNSREYAGSPKPSQHPTGRLEAASPLAVGFPSLHSGLSGEDDGAEPSGDGADKHAEEGTGEDVSMRATREVAAGAQGIAGAEASEQMEASGTPEAVEPEGSSWRADSSVRAGSPQLAPRAPESLQARQLHSGIEPAPPAKLPPRPRAAGPRPRPDPYKAGLSHYGKLFSFLAKMPLEKAALEMVEKCLDKYFRHLYNDLEVFAAHAGRKTVQLEDLELLMRRQGLVTEQVSLHVLVERYLPLEYRQLLIPCASSGNAVFPTQ
ncbi:centromere protein T [Echinops telfairi]|uniref:Centromere protein T n=1 Tax=Echinops telfairi TaxID=9371 RepID=A0AC55DDC3_ECHTE|nr:centromere protein T [Echinops telfairi]